MKPSGRNGTGFVTPLAHARDRLRVAWHLCQRNLLVPTS
jgi:hypothetical protein